MKITHWKPVKMTDGTYTLQHPKNTRIRYRNQYGDVSFRDRFEARCKAQELEQTNFYPEPRESDEMDIDRHELDLDFSFFSGGKTF